MSSPPAASLPIPFDPNLDAKATGEALADAYARFTAHNDPALPNFAAACCVAAGDAHSSTARAARATAALAAASDRANAYHNANHTREVMASALWLALMNNHLAAHGVLGARSLAPTDITTLILLAASHDIDHDGTSNANHAGGYQPFRLEDIAFARAIPVLVAEGFAATERTRLHALLRSTDPEFRPHMRRMTDHALWHRPPASPPPVAFQVLEGDRAALAIAALLADADILSSAALTLAYHRVQNARLEEEIGQRFQPADVLHFLDVIVGGDLASAAGRYLSPNFHAIRAQLIDANALAVAAQSR